MRVLLTFAIGLAACTPRTSDKERAELADMNARNALAKVEELSSRVTELEEKLETEERVRKAVDASLAKNADELARRHNLVVDHVYGQR